MTTHSIILQQNTSDTRSLIKNIDIHRSYSVKQKIMQEGYCPNCGEEVNTEYEWYCETCGHRVWCRKSGLFAKSIKLSLILQQVLPLHWFSLCCLITNKNCPNMVETNLFSTILGVSPMGVSAVLLKSKINYFPFQRKMKKQSLL